MAKGVKTGGRQKGVPNKISGHLKDMIIDALILEGGVEYLRKQAQENPASFNSLLGRVLPLQVTGADGGPVQISFPASQPTYDKL